MRELLSTPLVFVVLGCILLFAFVAVLCVFHAIWRLHCEKKFFTVQEKQIGKCFEVSPPDIDKKILKNLRQWHNDCLISNHLTQRVDIILQSQENDPTSAKELPQLHDLHELTMQNELGYIASATLRTIISFLLILGILGTLVGVHGAVTASSARLVPNMAQALLPSMIAVLCTVVLMWLRGWYAARVDEYIELLDYFSMTVLLPKLQPSNELQTDIHNLNSNMTDFSATAKAVSDVAAHLNTYTEDLNREAEKFQQAVDSVGALFDRLANLEKSIDKETEREFAALEKRLSALSPKLDELDSAGKELAEQWKFMQEQARAADKNIKILKGVMEKNNTHTVKAMKQLHQIAEDAQRFQTYAKIVQSLDSDLKSLYEESEKIETAYQTMQNDARQLNAIVTQALDINTDIFESNKKLDTIHNQMSDYLKSDYSKTVEQTENEIKDKLTKVNEAGGHVLEASKHLIRVFRKRVRIIG